jgi:YVTN family beta-propeller protein
VGFGAIPASTVRWCLFTFGAQRPGVDSVRRELALLRALWVCMAVVVVELAALAFVPVTAHADGSSVTAYVTTSGSNTVTPIDLATNTPGDPVAVGDSPDGIAVTPNGTTAYVTNVGSATVTPIAVTTNTPGTPIAAAGKGGFAIAITPDGTSAYVANDATNTVTPIDLTTNTAGTPIPVSSGPFGIAITSIPQAIPTSTQMTVTTLSPPAAATTETITATITPATAAGSVQFTDWAMPLGSPVTVTDGSASLTTTLTPGTHTLTAAFTPAGSTAFDPSASGTLSYTVSAPTTTPSTPMPPAVSRVPPTSFPQLMSWLLGQLHLPTI